MATSLKKYKVRPGTIDVGKDYEMKVAAYLSLRCVFSSEGDMWLASNPDGVGALDDVILCVKKPGGNTLTYMLQLKHKETPEPIKKRELLSESTQEAFSLVKYYRDIDLLNESIRSTAEKEEIINELGKFSNIYFVLFTNRDKPTETCTFCTPIDKSHIGNLSFISTIADTKSNAYVFDTEQLTDSCISKAHMYIKFYLLTNQVNAKLINAKIMDELARIANKLRLQKLNLKDVSEKYAKFITDWAKGDLGGNYCLTLKDVIWKLTALFLHPYEFDLPVKPFEEYIWDKNITWNEIIEKKSIVVVDSSKTVNEFLVQYLANEVVQYCKKPSKSWADTLSEKAQNYSMHVSLETQMFKIVGQFGRITMLDLYKCLWMTGNCPLLLEINKEEEYQDIFNTLQLLNLQAQVIVINKVANFSPKNQTSITQLTSLQDLNDDQQAKILNQSVKLQGRASAKLKDLLDETMFSHIKCSDIIKIMLHQFNVGVELKQLPPYFIKRSTVKVLIKSRVLEEVKNEIFLLSNSSEKCNNKILDLESADLTNLASGTIFTVNEIETPQCIKSSKHTVHHLSVYDEDHLEWKWSSGTTKNIRPFQASGDAFEDNIDHYFKNAVNIISEVPGMGKSVLIDFIALQALTCQWVLRIDLNAHQKYFREMQNSKIKATQHLKDFYDALFTRDQPNDRLNKMVFQKLMKEKNILVLLDGFDEVAVSYKDEVTDMAKRLVKAGYRLWLTTRPHLKDHLEREFDTFTISLKPFTIDDQKEFLMKYFRKETPMSEINPEDFVGRLLQVARSNLHDQEATLTGVALQTRLLADFFAHKWKDFVDKGTVVRFNEKFDLLKLYQSFIMKKFDALCDKFGEQIAETYGKFVKHQKLFALQLVFRPERFDEIGIIKDLDAYYAKKPDKAAILQRNGIMMMNEKGDLSCIHRTFAEYLAAEWLSTNLDSSDLHIKDFCLTLIKDRSTLQYNFLFNIFDRLVGQDCPLHMAIINGHMGEAKRIINSNCDDLFQLDDFGRTALHIVPLYNRSSAEFSFVSDSFETNTMDIIKKLPDDREFYSKPDLLGYSPLDYALENRVSSIIAEAICTKISFLTINAYVFLSDKEMYLIRCRNSGHNFLFDSLLPYFISRELLMYCVRGRSAAKYTDKNTRVKNYLNGITTNCPENMTVLEYVQSDKGNIYSGFSNNYYSDIRFALAFGSRDNVKSLLLQGVEVNKQDVDGNTPLHYATGVGDLEVVKLILSKGALSHILNFTFMTPLDVADRKQNFPVLEVLISSLVNSDRAYKGRKSLLHYVAEYGHFQDVDKLFKSEDVNKLDNYRSTPLHWALIKRNLDMAKLLIINGADVNICDNLDRNAFHYAVIYNCVNIIADFKGTTANINKQDANGETPLHLAVSGSYHGHDEHAIPLLLAKGASVNVQNLKGETPLHLAAKGFLVAKAVKLLLDGADVNIQNERGETALHVAANRLSGVNFAQDGSGKTIARKIAEESPFHIIGNVWAPYLLTLPFEDERSEDVDGNIFKLLILEGVNVNIKNKDGASALHVGIASGNTYDVIAMLSTPAVVNININQQDRDGNSYLHAALKKFKLGAILALIANGIDLNIQNQRGETALHLAAYQNYYVTFLIVYFGADLDKQDNDGNTPLHLAFYEGFVVIAELLVSANARIDIKNKLGDTALHCACRNGYIDIFDKPMSQDVDLNVQNNKGDTPLHIATSLGRLKPDEWFYAPDNFDCEGIVHKLLKNVDINVQNNGGETALHIAVKKGQMEIAALLLEHNADVNLRNDEGKTALNYAVASDHHDFAIELVLKGADVNGQDSFGNTLLHLACLQKRTDMANCLISHGANFNLKNNEEKTAFHFAPESIFNSLTSKFISENRGLNKKDAKGNTLLNLAIINGFGHAAKLLLENKVDVNVRNNQGYTSLHCASENGRSDLVALILNRGANIDKRNGEDNTSLHLAVQKEHAETVGILISKGARLDIVNSPFGEGHTPLHLAVILNNSDIAKLLLDNGANAAKQTKTGRNVLHYVKDYNLAAELVLKGADVNATDCDGSTPLHVMTSPNIAKLFLINGAILDVQDKNGNTPLILAARAGFCSTVTELIFQCADVNLQNASGETALLIALEETYLGITVMLLAFGADPNLKNLQSRTALSIAINSVVRAASLNVNNKHRDWKKDGLARYRTVLKQWTSVLNFLVNNTEDLNAPDSDGNSHLHCASTLYNVLDFDAFDLPEFDDEFEASYSAFHEDVVKLLLNAGVDVDVKNNNGKTALDVSYDYGNTNITALLLEKLLQIQQSESESE